MMMDVENWEDIQKVDQVPLACCHSKQFLTYFKSIVEDHDKSKLASGTQQQSIFHN
jgi:hypothetical protein